MNIIIGNIISFIAALFMILSCMVNNRSRVFMFQFINALLLAVASIFFVSYAGVASLILSAIRNLIVSKDRFTKNIMIIFMILSFVIGIIVNNRGLIGFLPILATLQYTFCSYYIKDVQGTRYSIWINLFMWVIYSFSILDFSTGISDFTTLVINTVSIFKYKKENKEIQVN